ncbi:MAG TPA: DUF2087 domain-containing protein [Casimicrobiaceae bacterium]|nr:DUF2087 domain-containing protein [Casimicrobiaceae bacterium]
MTQVSAAADRFVQLALRRGLSLGVLASSSPADFAIVLAAAAASIAPSRTYTEREVNDRLRAWLEGPGAMLATDHVELRRWLVDNALLARDGFGRAYWRTEPDAEIAEVLAGLADVDLVTLCAQARSRDADERARRKARWVARSQDA